VTIIVSDSFLNLLLATVKIRIVPYSNFLSHDPYLARSISLILNQEKYCNFHSILKLTIRSLGAEFFYYPTNTIYGLL
jgi:hypothetical protein